MEFLGVILAAAAGFGFGAVWYGVNADRWMAAVGRTRADIEADKSPIPFIIAGLAALFAAATMRWIMNGMGMSGIGSGLGLGACLGAFVVAPWIVLHYGFSGRPRELWAIDGIHAFGAFVIMGLVLGLFV